jgi:hypothetical protein
MSARRIAVLVGSHDPAYFARDTQPHRPSEAAVLTALRTHPSRSDASHRAAAQRIPAHDGRSVARHAGARIGAGSRRAPDGAGPPRLRAFAAARTRRPVRYARERMLARAITGA